MQITKVTTKKHSLKAKVGLWASVCLLASCGNTWMTSGEREKSPSAMLAKAQRADDKGDYDTAISLYRELIEKDPNNDEIRIRLAYALNAKAGLGLFTLVEKLAGSSSSTETTTATATSTSTDTAASTSTSTSGLSMISKVVGLGATEKAEITNAFNATSDIKASALREKSALLATLHESWLAICRVLPAESLAKVIDSDATVKAAAESAKCKGGIENSKVRASARFAAALQLLAEGMILYQTVVDADGDGQVDLLKKATAISDDINKVQAQVATATPDKLTGLLTSINTSVANLKAVGDAFKGEAISLTLADFSLVAELVASIESLPDDLKTNIAGTVAKFTEAQNKMKDFSQTSTSTTSTSSSSTTPVAAVEKAAETINQIDSKISTMPEAEQAAAKEQVKQACTNFESVKTIYNLPATTKAPDSCNTTALTGPMMALDDAPAAEHSETPVYEGESVSDENVANTMLDLARLASFFKVK